MRSLTGARRRLVAAIDGLRGRPTRVWQELALEPPPRAPVPPLRTSSEPRVSVLVPVYGQLDVTLDCLESLAALRTDVPFEVLVLDDATPHEDMSPLAAVGGVRYLRAAENRGFLRNVNWGATQARGEILLLLNNDTLVDPGFLDPLVEVLDADPRVGAVGGMLLYPGGIVQEAGGIIWSDAGGWNYGRHDLATNARDNHRREVDYISGASLAVRRELWDRLGGFDERFAPAYYEDADLCFGVRSLGSTVVYEPRSRVVHLEGVSHGTDVSSGVKAHQAVNQATFAAKWADELREQYPPHTDHLLLARDRRPGPHIVVIDHIFPEPHRDAGSGRMAAITEILHELGYVVHFIPVTLRADGPLLDEWRAKGIEVLVDDEREHYWPVSFVRQLMPKVGAVLLSRPHVVGSLLLDFRSDLPGLPLVFDMVDAHGLRMGRQAELASDEVAAGAARSVHRFEEGLAGAVDAVLAVSQEEADLLAPAAGGTPFHVLPLVFTPRSTPTTPAGRSGALFIGGYQHPPNFDAANWFVRDVLPAVRGDGFTLRLAGSGVDHRVQALVGPQVSLTGFVEDLAALYDTVRVVVAPLRFGAGVKGKVVEAMAHGVPVVTTTVGAEGLHLEDGVNCLIADDAASFAAAVDRLLVDDELWLDLAARGSEHVERWFSRTAARRSLVDLFSSLGCPPPASAAAGQDR